MKAIWLTDLHLNFVSSDGFTRFFTALRNQAPDCILVGGDIGEAHDFRDYLVDLQEKLSVPVYFVLGNHDFYKGSFNSVCSIAEGLERERSNIVWLKNAGVVPLSNELALIGHDSWADGRYGDFWNSTVMLNDFALIQDLRLPDKNDIFQCLNKLGDAAAEYLTATLLDALQQFQNVMLLTHIPPFRESCWYRGKISDENFLPFFACKSVGDAIKPIMARYPEKELIVLCGHTHSSGVVDILPNLRVLTGSAEYGNPYIQHVFEY